MTEKQETNLTILIDKISTPKLEIFGFQYGKKLISQSPFTLKSPIPGTYNYQHHWNRGDLENLSKTYPTIFPYDDRIERTGKDITPNTYERLMKYEIYTLISTGKFNRRIERETDIINLTIIWKGEEIQRPTEFKEIPKKKEKEKTEKIEGLTF